MAKIDKFSVLTRMEQTPIVPVFYHPDPTVACAVLKACYDGGVRVFEFTNRGDGADEVFRILLQYALKECPELALGVGTIIDAPTAAHYIQMGACFVVAPLLNKEVALVCNRHGIPYIPGCGSVTEVGQAQELGCDFVKVFPGNVLGLKFVKALMAPMPWTRIMVTGGVEPNEENISAWIKAGTRCLGMGSKLFPKDKVSAADWAYITQQCRNSLDIIRKIKQS